MTVHLSALGHVLLLGLELLGVDLEELQRLLGMRARYVVEGQR